MIDGVNKIYLSGPMTGLPEFNFPAFHAAAKKWRDAGYAVVNPAELEDGDTTKCRAYYMRRDIQMLIDCDAIAMLSGWQSSRGANVEFSVARDCGILVLDAETMMPLQPCSILIEAHRLVYGPREEAYDSPANNFRRIAALWSIALERILKENITAEHVGIMMLLLKIARESYRHKRDNIVDIAGYANTLQMVYDAKALVKNETD